MMQNFLQKCIYWGFIVWLLLWPWQTILIIRQVEKHGSLWSAGALGLPLMAALIGGIIGLVLWQKKIIFNPKIISVLLVGGFLIWRAPDSLISLQLGLFWCLGVGVVYLSTQQTLSQKMWFTCLLVGACLPIVFGLGQFFLQSSGNSTALGVSAIPSYLPGAPVIVGDGARWLRASGPFPHPNIFAGYCVMILATICLASKKNILTTTSEQWGLRLLAILTSAALLTSFSRSGILSLGCLLGWELWQITKNTRFETKIILFSILITTSVGIGLLGPVYWSRFTAVGTVPQELTAITERVVGMAEAWILWKQNWLFGVGLGNYTVELAELFPILKGYELQPVHSVGLLFLVEWGVIGLILVGWFLRWAYQQGFLTKYTVGQGLWLLPFLLFDHFLYDIWSGIIIGAIHISSTFYPHLGLTKPKK